MLFTSWLRLRSALGQPVKNRSARRKRWVAVPPSLEWLEDRTLLSTFTVLNTGDNGGVNPSPGAGTGTLRQAIVDADAAGTGTGATPDQIQFSIPTTDPGYQSVTGAFSIKPLSALPTITDTVIVDGYTQPGASPNTLTIGDNAVLKIVVDGSLGGSVEGLVIAASNCTVRGLVIDNFAVGSGINLGVNNASPLGGNNLVVGNFIGTDVTGVSAAANSNGIYSASPGNMIGGSSPADRNIISGNNSALPNAEVLGVGGVRGINVGSNGNQIQGNYIGTDKSGTFALPNGYGISVNGGELNETIGGLTDTPGTGAGNVISGNFYLGVQIENGNLNLLVGNLIGTTATGLAALGNGQGGAVIDGNNNTIGGTAAGARNIISANQENIGFEGLGLGGAQSNVVQGNYIGCDINGTTALGGVGIGIGPFAAYNVIGGTTAAARNIISGGDAIVIGGIPGNAATAPFDNTVLGNYIGTDPSGTRVVRTGYGIDLQDEAHDNIIGGTARGAGNVISGTAGAIRLGINSSGVNNNFVQGNLIGTDKTGTVALGNGGYGGIYVGNGGSSNTIGGTSAAARNIIAFGVGNGVTVDSGTGNSILGNAIFSNGGLGILLNSTNNANDNQAAPVLTSASTSATGTAISGTLAGYANSAFRIEFFVNPPGVSAEGQTFVGFAQVTTDSQGNFTANLATALPPGTNLTATATVATPDGQGGYTYGDTSEFAANSLVKAVLTVSTNSNLMLVGNNPPPLTGSVNGIPFTRTINYTTPYGDVITITLITTATSASSVGQYSIGASASGANSGNYVLNLTAGTMYVVSIGADPDGSGAQAVTFWDNKGNATLITAADLSSLDLLNLVNQGGAAFDPKAVAQLQAWLSISPNATTAYQLAVQLAAMDLNVLVGYVHATDLVYAGALLPYATTYGITGLSSGGFITIQDLMSAANAVLSQVSPGNPSGDPNQSIEAALTQVLQAANGNTDFVQP